MDGSLADQYRDTIQSSHRVQSNIFTLMERGTLASYLFILGATYCDKLMEVLEPLFSLFYPELTNNPYPQLLKEALAGVTELAFTSGYFWQWQALDDIARLASVLPNLRVVSLLGKGLQAEALNSIVRACPLIEDLSLDSIYYSEGTSWTNDATNVRLLQMECSSVGDEQVKDLCALKQLRFLSLTNSRSITDDSIATLLPSLPQLEGLALLSITELLDPTLLAIATHCPQLQFLRLEHMYYTDTGFTALFKALTSLKVLSVSSIAGNEEVPLVTDAPFEFIPTSLEWLHMTNVWEFDSQEPIRHRAFAHISQRCTELKRLGLWDMRPTDECVLVYQRLFIFNSLFIG